MSLQPGATLLNGQYRIVRLLGRGGFGFVYLAQDTLLREDVAIKELIPALVGDESLLKRFLAEAKATMRLRHERIVATHAVFSEAGNYYIVMEYLAGGSLEARLAERAALPVDEAVHVAADVAEGLAYAHEHKVVHCDLKPANVLFTADGRAKIADFGIAHVPQEMFSRSWLTPSGFVAGTLPYMSPEQADGVRDDPRADLYALGAVLYRMLTGRPYLDFDRQDTPGAQARNVQRIQAELPVAPSVHNRRVPAWLDGVVLKALAKRPEERYANASELRAALARKGATVAPVPASAEAEMVVASTPPRPAPVPPQPRPRPQPQPLPRWLWPAVGGAAVLLIAVIVALAASMSGGGKKGAVTPAPPAVALITAAPSVTARPPTVTTRPTETTPAPRPAVTSAPPTSTPSARPTERSTPTPTFAPTATATPRPAFTVKQATINVRGGPGTVYPVIGTLRQGQTFEITGQNAAGDWWQFTYNGKPGWVSASVVNANSQAAGAPVVTAPPTPISTPTGGGGKIAFNRAISGGWQAHVIRPDGTGLKQITNMQGGIGDPAISPDGSKLIFLGPADQNRVDLFVIDLDGSNLTNITKSPAERGWPNWSPDGKRIAFAAPQNGAGEIYLMYADGTGVTRLTNNRSEDLCPAISPDGRKIAFSSNRGGTWEIYIMNIDGTGVIKLTSIGDPRGQGWPAWSPDGQRIAFETEANGNREVYVVNADGTDPTNVTKHLSDDGAPAWSPDGRMLAFSSNRNEKRGIYVIGVDGSGVRMVHEGWDWGATWSWK